MPTKTMIYFGIATVVMGLVFGYAYDTAKLAWLIRASDVGILILMVAFSVTFIRNAYLECKRGLHSDRIPSRSRSFHAMLFFGALSVVTLTWNFIQLGRSPLNSVISLAAAMVCTAMLGVAATQYVNAVNAKPASSSARNDGNHSSA